MNYDWDWAAVAVYWKAVGLGFSKTLALTGLTICIGTPLGAALGVLIRHVPSRSRWVVLFLMDIARSIPPLVLILLSYYFLPSVVGLKSISPFQIACLALSIYLAAFTADVVRGALAAVPSGIIDAGLAVGLSRRVILLRIEIPWLVRSLMPTLTLLWIGMLKNSSLASVIGVYELTHTGDLIIGNTFRSVETYVVIAGLYVLITLPFSIMARKFEDQLRTKNVQSL